MAIDFTLTTEQKRLQADVRSFAENVLAPAVREADAERDPLRGFQRTKAPYVEAYKRGIAMCFVPEEYGGGGVSNVDLILAAEEICAVDPRFACTVLCNALGLMPVIWYGSEEQKDRFLRAATSDPTGEYLGVEFDTIRGDLARRRADCNFTRSGDCSRSPARPIAISWS